MNGFKGTNASKHILNPAAAGHQREIEDLRTSKPSSVFLRAVVTHVLCDPLLLSEEEKSVIKQSISNPDYFDTAPRNSIVCRIITDGADKRGNLPLVCYPFFSSHFELPIKSGEQVWIVYDNPTLESSLAYWMSRIPESRQVEDANYTHGDRRFARSSSPTTSEKVESKPKQFDFPNGGGTSTSTTLKGVNDYEVIISQDPAYKDFTPEDVPRYNKRPGEFTLQGSNNTLISLGDYRIGSSHVSNSEKTGQIDIVVGRVNLGGVVENTRGNQETDKTVDGPAEGNIDLAQDASRLILTQLSNSDEDFQLGMPDAFDGHPIESRTTSHAVLKSNEIRLISRGDGSIRLVKEGTQGNNAVSLVMLSDGTAQLDAELIFLGRPGGLGPGPNGLEPYIKFSKYKSQMTTLITQVNAVLNALIASFPTPVAAPGTPHPGLTAVIPQLNTTLTELNKLQESLDEAMSERIFGE